MKSKHIPRKVLAEAVKKAGTFVSDLVLEELDYLTTNEHLSDYALSELREKVPTVRFIWEHGFHYSPYIACEHLTADDFIECWSGDVNNPTVRRHKVGNCKVKI
ncbi:hypothetical protein LCGC14_1126350 [marine sediment metagenome]|uniref:Uncharacterized protein n=1 Tax=marine sediment metagenome TaxID=412755 RepID=A0A0F9MQB0_9ZZZZ